MKTSPTVHWVCGMGRKSGTPERCSLTMLVGLWLPMAPAAGQEGNIRVVVVEGQDRFNIIGQGTPAPTVVEVRDGNDDPVSGASVVFRLLEGGRSTLNAGLQEAELTTNSMGRASVTVNPLAGGEVELSVVATFRGVRRPGRASCRRTWGRRRKTMASNGERTSWRGPARRRGSDGR